jgi:hypothetical protein
MRYVIYWLITCIVFTVFFFMNNAHAAQQWYEFQTDTFRVVLMSKDCPSKAGLVAFREFQGDVAYGCWSLAAGKVHILWDKTNRVSAIPLEVFVRKETE